MSDAIRFYFEPGIDKSAPIRVTRQAGERFTAHISIDHSLDEVWAAMNSVAEQLVYLRVFEGRA